jgi:hypothetical protein
LEGIGGKRGAGGAGVSELEQFWGLMQLIGWAGVRREAVGRRSAASIESV